MAAGWEALRLALIYAVWPGLLAVSIFALLRAGRLYRRLVHNAPGMLILLTVSGWVATLVAMAVVVTLFFADNAETAGPIVVPVFVLWAQAMVVVVWFIHRWGQKTESLDQHYDHMEKMELVKNGFINHVAHELNTPMTPILMDASILASGAHGALNDRQAAVMVRLRRNLDRLNDLVARVLVANRVQAGLVELERSTHHMLWLTSEAITKAGLSCQVAGDTAVVASVDAGRITYALQTLCQEIEGRPGGLVQEIQVTQEAKAAVLEVCYEGPTIEPAEFEVFSSDLDLREATGLAIGLFTVFGIVDAHGGTIDTSRPGCLKMTLPMAEGVAIQQKGVTPAIKAMR